MIVAGRVEALSRLQQEVGVQLGVEDSLIFLRVRKPGDSVLAGVSSQRLVQVRIVPG